MGVPTKEEKIALYKSLFTGRTDVFAQFWQSTDGKRKGWFPVHTDRNKTAYALLTDAVFENHLRGNVTIGVYPLLTNNTTWFVAADFDSEGWKAEVCAILSVCKEHELPTYVERSRSGNGAHVWWFFESPYSAVKARAIFLHLLTCADSIDPLDNAKSFDRIFPNQDFLSGKGLGNLIALPLQGVARKQNNTVFVDPDNDFAAYEDQWSLLKSAQRISIAHLDELFEVSKADKTPPSTLPAYSGAGIPFTINTHIIIPKAVIERGLANFLGEHLNFFNNEYAVKQRMGLSTYETERFFRTIEKEEEHIKVPRGFLSRLLRYCNDQKILYQLFDQTCKSESQAYNFSCTLFDYQVAAVQALCDSHGGILVAPPGSGKTIMGLSLISNLNQSALILVHRKEIANQWLERVEHFLGIPKKKIGQVVGTKKKIQLPITVAMVQSLNRMENYEELANQFGLVLVDECHHMPAKMFRAVITKLRPKYLYGLTATPTRKHNDEQLIFIYLGDIVHTVENISTASANSEKDMASITINIRETSFHLPFKVSTRNYQPAIKALCFDTARNNQIVGDIILNAQAGKKCLVLTERKEHVDILAEYLKHDFEIIIMTGDVGTARKKEKTKQIVGGHFQIIIATGQLVGEGVHFPHLDALFFVYPFSFSGKLTQYIGRILHSNSVTKTVFDYRDSQLPYFDRMYKKRQKYYDKMYPVNR